MKLDEISKIIGAYAPTIGTMVGAPAGGVIVGLIAKAIGEENTGTFADKVIAGCKNTAQNLKALEGHSQLQNIGIMANSLYDIAKDIKNKK